MTALPLRFFSVLFLSLSFMLLSLTAQAQTSFTVTVTDDAGPGSLRQAITDVTNSSSPVPFTITVGVTGTISLTSVLPDIVDDIAFLGPGADNLTVRRNSATAFRIFHIPNDNLVSFDGFTIADGSASTAGGGILSAGRLTVANCILRTNQVTGSGGGIYSSNQLIVTSTLFASNTATASGGGIYTSTGSSATAVNVSFENNQATSQGGAVYVSSGAITLTNASFRGNSATTGRVFYLNGETTQLTNGVLFDNGAANNAIAGGTIQATYSLFEQNTSGFTADPSNLTTAVSPFANSTGTQLNACAPAINAGSNAAFTGVSSLTTDLAGNDRFVGGTVDMGAYEFQGIAITLTNPATTTATAGLPFSETFTATGGTAPYAFTLLSGSLPTGLTLTPAGSLSGTPTQTGAFTMTVQATDAGGCVDAGTTYTLTVTSCPTAYTVTSLADAGAGTLRQALLEIGASSCPGPFTVTFGVPGTVAVGFTLYAPNKDILLLGYSTQAADVVLSGGGPSSNYGLLNLSTPSRFEVRYVSFANAENSNGGAIGIGGGRLVAQYCHFYQNKATSFGGAIYHGAGSFTITNSTFSSNTAISNSGAIHKTGTDPCLIDNCTFSGNVGRAGGAIEAAVGSLTINNSTFTQNQAVGNPGTNVGAEGGAIFGSNTNPIVLNNCLIVGNSSLGTGPNLVSGFGSDLGHNLIGNTSGGATLGGVTTGNQTGTGFVAATILLPTVAGNGGPTPTHAILTRGAAYNAGPPASTDPDQRGLTIFGGRRDVGAFESQAVPVTATVGSVSGLCAGVGGFSLTAVGGTGSGYQYRLTNAGSFSALPTNPFTVTLSASGTYTLTVQDSDGMLSNAVAVTILSEPTSPTLSGVLNCSANSVTLTANCTVGTALWSTSAMSRTIVVPATAMIYSASCVTSNCTSESSSLMVNPTANSFTVTSTADSGPNTLRQAILDMNSALACEPFLITIDAPGPVSLTAALPELLKSVTITSANALTPATATGGSTIERATGSADFRLLLAKTTGKTLTLQNLILQNGVGTPLAGFPYSGGGAVMTRSTVVLTMQRCLVRNCTTVSGSDGGGVQAFSGRLTLSDCEFRNNAAAGSGGAVITGSYATINSSPTLIERCTFVGNSAINGTFGVGGAVNLSGPSTVVTSTFESNSASSSGKALYSYNPIVLRHSTFLNQAVSGASAVLATDNTITLQNNLFAQNTAPHFTGSYTSLGGNVSDKPDASTLNQATDRVGQLVSVSAAAANGGLVQTGELTGGCSNPAIDAGVATTLTADARGVAYVGAPDAGAYENGTGATSLVTVAYPATQTATVGLSFAESFTATGGTVPYAFTLLSGSLPTGLTLTPAGSLSGTPTQAGQFTMTVQATDANGCVALSNPYTLTVDLGCQAVLHVTESGSGLQNGSSWANAMSGSALQTAIDLAATCGAQVWVAQGLYKPTSTTGFSSRQVSFSMANGVAIYGGFAGLTSETALSNRPTVNPITGQPSGTTLSGDIGTMGDRSDNSFHVIVNPASLSLNNTAILDGFVIANGNADFGGFNDQGAGMFNDGNGSVCSPTIRNCSFLNNNAPNDGGAGIYNSANGGISSPTLINCLFSENTGQNGVAISNRADNSGISSATLTNCRFVQNDASVAAVIRNFAFTNSTCSPVIQNSTFERNETNVGGCIYNAAVLGGTSNPVIRNSVFIQNRLLGSGQGIITSATEFNSGTCHAVLTNCAFQSNSVNTGGTIVNLSGADAELINCSFLGNRGNIDGSVVSTGAACTLLNCAFWDNGPFNEPFKGPISTEYSLFPVSTTGVTGSTNLMVSVSPFASTTSTELAPCSPAIDAGNPATTSATVGNTDLAGNARLFNEGRIDIGAYEFAGTGLPLSYSVLGSGTATCAASPTLTLSGSETGVSYQLQRNGVGSGTALAGTGLSLTFGSQPQSGTYTVLATRTANSCTALMGNSATVVSSTAVPSVSISASSGTLTCGITSVTLTATTSETALLWSNGATTSIITVNAAATYSVTVTNANGCTAVSNSLTISQENAPPASPSLSANLSGTLTCLAPSLTLTASATGTSLTYAFGGPSGAVAGSGASRTINAAGTYSVTITGGNGCTTTASTTVSSNTAGPTAGLVSSGTITCANPTATLTASGAAGIPGGTYSFAGPGLLATLGASATVNVGGTYSVTVLNPITGCFSTTTVAISSDLGGAPAAPTLSASSSVVCAGGTVQVAASAGGAITGLQWYRNEQPVAGQTSATLTLGGVDAAQSGSYVLVLTGACSTTSAPFSLTVNSAPVVTLSVINGGVVLQATGGVLYERVIVIDRINNYEIRQVDSSTTGFFNITREGPYRLVVTGANGCKTVVESSIASLPR